MPAPNTIIPEDEAREWRALAAEHGLIMDLAVHRRPGGRKGYAHVTAATHEGLHNFAFTFSKRIQQRRTRPHFDAPEDIILELLKMGVRVVSSREVLMQAKALALIPRRAKS